MFTKEEYKNMTREEAFARLPEKLQEYVRQTTRPYIRIKADVAEKELSITSSKFGGVPFILEGEDVPVDNNGAPCYLFAQINFCEVAEVTHLSELPDSGLLQVFLSTEDYHDGYKSVKKRFRYISEEQFVKPNHKTIEKARARYHEIVEYKKKFGDSSYEVRKAEAQGVWEKYPVDFFLPVFEECALTFTYDEMGANSCDHGEFDHMHLYEELEENEELFWSMTENELLFDKVTRDEQPFHHILCYPQAGEMGPKFDHNDRFVAEKEGRHMMRADPMVLLAIDGQWSDASVRDSNSGHWLIMPGNYDFVHCLITKEDIKNKNFSNMTIESAMR